MCCWKVWSDTEHFQGLPIASRRSAFPVAADVRVLLQQAAAFLAARVAKHLLSNGLRNHFRNKKKRRI
jgi:hypothetical protein